MFSDFHQKQAAKKALMKKALDKNPDEFYFKMIRTRMEVSVLFHHWPYAVGCDG